MFRRERCSECGQLAIIFDDAEFECTNDTCAQDARRERERPPRLTREKFMEPFSLVYYLAFADRIKIGVTSDLNQRLQAIPHDELLAFERGSLKLERVRHRQFAGDLVPGQREWFFRSPELLAHIEAISAGMEDVRTEASRVVKRALLGLTP